MRAPTTAATSDVRRQLRRVRWGRNLLAAQVGLFGIVAASAAAAAVVIVLALRAAPATFAAGLGACAVALAVSVVLVARRARATWVRRRDAAAWVDATAGLDGRLTTLLALDGRNAPLMPLLRAQNEERRRRWTPERLIASPFPPLALGAAVLASVALLAVLMAAPSLRPAPPPMVEQASRATIPVDGLDEALERVLTRGDGTGTGGAPSADVDGAAGATGHDAASATARLPAALQRDIRRRLWGERFAGAADAGARTGSRRASRARAAGRDPRGAERDVDGGVDGDGRPLDDADATARGAGGGDAAGGAGTGSDPNVLGVEMDDVAGGDGRFALGLAARVLGRRAGTEPPSGAPPPRADDRRPALASRQRPAEAFHATAIPPAYRPIVRSLFAHGAVP